MVRGVAIGWGTALQTGRSRVRFPTGQLLIDLIFRQHYDPGVDSKWVFPGGKGDRYINFTNLLPRNTASVKLVESWGPVKVCRKITSWLKKFKISCVIITYSNFKIICKLFSKLSYINLRMTLNGLFLEVKMFVVKILWTHTWWA